MEVALALVALLPLAGLVLWLFSGAAEDAGEDGGAAFAGPRAHVRDVVEREP